MRFIWDSDIDPVRTGRYWVMIDAGDWTYASGHRFLWRAKQEARFYFRSTGRRVVIVDTAETPSQEPQETI